MQVEAAPIKLEERPLIVSLKPFRFHNAVPVPVISTATLPKPKPFGMTSLLLLIKILFTVVAAMMVFPVQLSFVPEMLIVPERPGEPNVKLNPPEIGPAKLTAS